MSQMFLFITAIAIGGVTLYGLMRVFPSRSQIELLPTPLDDGESPPAGPDEVRVVGVTRVGRGQSLVLVEIAGRRLLLGSTRAQWCALADLGVTPAPADANPFGPIEAELARAMRASRDRKGWKRS
jgi:flagellar biogenesis protein FliO